MIKDYMIEKGEIIMHTYGGIVTYSDVNGKVHQGIVLYFINNAPVWSRP